MTIVVILILAAVTIDAVFSEDGIINKAKEAANAMNNAVANDQASLNNLYNELNDIMNGIGGSGEEGDSNSETNTEPEPPETDKPIGDENEKEQLKDFSVITFKHKVGNRDLGTIGIIGPKRMDYSKVISVMKYINKKLNEKDM